MNMTCQAFLKEGSGIENVPSDDSMIQTKQLRRLLVAILCLFDDFING
jgi:hypothetical protein